MSLKKITSQLDLFISLEERKFLESRANSFIDLLKLAIKKNKIVADVFLGGSLAKKTVVKSDSYEIDVFIRFDLKYEDLSSELEKIVKTLTKQNNFSFEKVHGSRDYFKIELDNLLFEIIPVLKIKNPKDARNVTDLSYFHVGYVHKKLKNEKISREIVLAKSFFKASGVYGAESYINGFSGYAVECLIMAYGSFEKMLKSLIRYDGKKIVLDPDKKFKNKNEVFFELNESKLHSPVILIDPTLRERNVLAALSDETFEKFRIVAMKFLKNPTARAFQIIPFDKDKFVEKANKKKNNVAIIQMITDKQEGDIAGTKLKKFSNFIIREIEKYYTVVNNHFEYSMGKSANLYLNLKSKNEIIRKGPPVKMIRECQIFKKSNRSVFEKNGMLYAKIKIDSNMHKVINDILLQNSKTSKDMNIIDLKLLRTS